MERRKISFSNKITILGFLLSIGVVYQHTQWKFLGGGYATWIYNFLFYLIETCVPFFFMISGYLFFRTYKVSNLKEKLISRVHTL